MSLDEELEIVINAGGSEDSDDDGTNLNRRISGSDATYRFRLPESGPVFVLVAFRRSAEFFNLLAYL